MRFARIKGGDDHDSEENLTNMMRKSEKRIVTKLIFHEKTKTSPQVPLSLVPPLPGQI